MCFTNPLVDLHHIYVNPKAPKGRQTGKFANVSVIVFALLEAKAEGNAFLEGKRKPLGVKHRDSRQYAATDGWGFEGLGSDKARRARQCGQGLLFLPRPQQDHNHFCSAWRD